MKDVTNVQAAANVNLAVHLFDGLTTKANSITNSLVYLDVATRGCILLSTVYQFFSPTTDQEDNNNTTTVQEENDSTTDTIQNAKNEYWNLKKADPYAFECISKMTDDEGALQDLISLAKKSRDTFVTMCQPMEATIKKTTVENEDTSGKIESGASEPKEEEQRVSKTHDYTVSNEEEFDFDALLLSDDESHWKNYLKGWVHARFVVFLQLLFLWIIAVVMCISSYQRQHQKHVLQRELLKKL